MNRYLTSAILSISVFFSTIVASQEHSVSTKVISASYIDESGIVKQPCQGKMGSQLDSYISISIDKMFVRRQDGFAKSLFDRNRGAYPIAKFSADFAGNQLNIYKVTSITRVYGNQGTADLLQGWELLDRLPYTFLKPKITLIIASNSDSNIDGGIKMFENVTAAIPDVTVAASTTTAMAIASAFDSYFLAPERTVNAMKSEYEFPNSAGKLCEGAFVVFASRDPLDYQHYRPDNLKVSNGEVLYNGQSINNISHGIFRLKITPRYYEQPSDAFNDPNKMWATHFNKVSTYILPMFGGVTQNRLSEFDTNANNNILIGADYLMNDPYLLMKEKLEILKLVNENYQTVKADLLKSVERSVDIADSTVQVFKEEIKANSTVTDEIKSIAQQIDNGETVTLKRVPRTLREPLKDALQTTDKLLQEQIETVNEVIATEAVIQ